MEKGTKVAFIDEPGKGTIVEMLSSTTALVALDDGIEIPVPIDKLVVQHHVKASMASEGVFNSVKDKMRDDSKAKTRTRADKGREQQLGFAEVDLHIEELLDSYKHMTNSEILSIQIEHCQRSLETAMSAHARGIYIIHGVGDGVLRKAVHELLSSYQNLEFFDAPYKRFGFGATEVRFYNT